MRGVVKGFVCKDPRGVVISCSKEQWNYLIKHREMVGQQGVVKAVIKTPDYIYQSRNFKSRNTYYKRLVLPEIGDTYVRVVVELKEKTTGTQRGYVINAFASSGSQKGERLLWEKKV